jgi:hypothetical protein
LQDKYSIVGALKGLNNQVHSFGSISMNLAELYFIEHSVSRFLVENPIPSLSAIIKAEHESGSSTGTHEYTRGNTRG